MYTLPSYTRTFSYNYLSTDKAFVLFQECSLSATIFQKNSHGEVRMFLEPLAI